MNVLWELEGADRNLVEYANIDHSKYVYWIKIIFVDTEKIAITFREHKILNDTEENRIKSMHFLSTLEKKGFEANPEPHYTKFVLSTSKECKKFLEALEELEDLDNIRKDIFQSFDFKDIQEKISLKEKEFIKSHGLRKSTPLSLVFPGSEASQGNEKYKIFKTIKGNNNFIFFTKETEEKYHVKFLQRVYTPLGYGTVIGEDGDYLWFWVDGHNGISYWNNIEGDVFKVKDFCRIGNHSKVLSHKHWVTSSTFDEQMFPEPLSKKIMQLFQNHRKKLNIVILDRSC